MKTTIVGGLLIAASVIVWTFALSPLPPQSDVVSAAQVSTFDHSNCQYPYRWSNPVDGCDNSDPAVPECIKAATTKESEAECIAAFVASMAEPEPVQSSPKPAPVDVSECGGK